MAAAAAARDTRHPSRPPLAPAPAAHAPNSTTASSTSRRAKPAPSSRHLSTHSSCPARLATPAPHPPASPSPPVATTMRMRSLSVSFQGESFVYQTPRATPRRAPAGSSRRRGEAENERPRNLGQGAKTRGAANALAQSLDCSLHRKESILAAVRLLRSSMAPDSAASEAATDNSGSSDTDAASPDSCCNLAGGGTTWPGVATPARFWQETNSRLRRLPESGWPHSSASARRSFLDDSMLPRVPGTSPSRSPGSQSSASPSRGLDGKEAGPPVKAPSIISFATEVRRANKGENKIEEAHRLRLLDNRHLQWRCVNARVDAALLARSCSAEKALHSAWKDISVLRDSVSFKRSKLQLQKQKLKIFAILKGQISYLEEWSHIENRHLSSLSAAIKALKASTIRLPIVGGAKADAQGVKEVVNSAVDVMNTMASSMCSLLSKVEGTSSTVFELAKVAAQEQMLLDQSRDLFSAVAVMHVKQCSLQAHILQGKQKLGQMQL